MSEEGELICVVVHGKVWCVLLGVKDILAVPFPGGDRLSWRSWDLRPYGSSLAFRYSVSVAPSTIFIFGEMYVR